MLAFVLALVVLALPASATQSGVYPVSIMTSPIAMKLMQQATASYAVDHPEFRVGQMQAPTGSTTLLQSMFLGGTFDFGLMLSGMSPAQRITYPAVASYPLIANAVVLGYNLPASAGQAQLLLTPTVLCLILRAEITKWNDPRLQVHNPNLVLPNLNITVVHFSTSSGTNDAISSYCGKVDPIFAAQIPRSFMPMWPLAKYAAYLLTPGGDSLASAVIDTVGAFSFPTLQTIVGTNAVYAALKNSDGTIVQPSVNSISLNVLELAAQPLPAGASGYDLTAPKSPNAWPICSLIYMWLDIANPRATCATKEVVLSFILSLYQSSAVRLLASAQQMAIMSDLYLTATGLIDTLKRTVQCQGSPLISSATNSAYIQGFSAMREYTVALTNYYSTVNTNTKYSFQQSTEELATERLRAGEVDLVLLNTRQLASTDIALMTSDGGAAFVPGFMAGVAITFMLPPTINNRWRTWTTLNTGGLPRLAPLALDVETVAGIFTGRITSWLDPAILATSPQLQAWFNAFPAVNPLFNVVVCCSSASEQQAAGLMLMQALNGTSYARDAVTGGYFQVPLAWTQQLGLSGARFTMVDTETRMTTKSSNLQLLGMSTISYRMMQGAVSDPTVEFQIVQTVNSAKETIAPSPTNFIPCVKSSWSTDKFVTADLVSPSSSSSSSAAVPQTPGCYPLGGLVSFGVNTKYEGDACHSGNRSLNLLKWIVNTDALSTAALNAGLLRLADLPSMYASTMSLLYSATCDGETLLITLPNIWSVNAGVEGFSVAMAVIGLILFSGSGIVTFLYQSNPVLRSSSVPFLVLILVGLSMLIASLLPLSATVTSVSCESFMWLASLGFSLVFVPFFAKTYRIYVIFSRRHLRVVKMSNKRLLLLVSGLITVELILMLSWSQVSPLQPVTYLKNVGGTMHQATHCSVQGEGMAFVIIEAVYKALLLGVGALLAFSTRKVNSSFNESSAIAMSIYNVLFSSIIVGAIVYFVGAFEDTLILLFVFLIFWVAFLTYGLLFATKFYVMFTSTEAEAALESKLSSIQNEKSEGGFSFLSVASMSLPLLKGYIGALEQQLGKARKQMTNLLGATGQGLGVKAVLPARRSQGSGSTGVTGANLRVYISESSGDGPADSLPPRPRFEGDTEDAILATSPVSGPTVVSRWPSGGGGIGVGVGAVSFGRLSPRPSVSQENQIVALPPRYQPLSHHPSSSDVASPVPQASASQLVVPSQPPSPPSTSGTRFLAARQLGLTSVKPSSRLVQAARESTKSPPLPSSPPLLTPP